MSLHLNRQCQRADAHPLPVRMFRASVVPTKKRRETNTDLFPGRVRCWSRHICGGPTGVNRVFAILLQLAVRTPRCAADTSIEIGIPQPGSRPQTAESTELSGAL